VDSLKVEFDVDECDAECLGDAVDVVGEVNVDTKEEIFDEHVAEYDSEIIDEEFDELVDENIGDV